MIQLPRLLRDDGGIQRIINPVKVSITQNIVPLSTATITIPTEESIPARSYVELFTPYGSAGVFRVRSPRDAYGDEITTVELEHAISEVGDYLVKAEYKDMYNVQTAMKNVFSHYKGSRWKLGSISDLGNGNIGLQAQYVRVLDAMLSILSQKPDCMMAFDFSTKPWTVSVVKKGTSVTAEGRLSRNVRSAVVTYDDSELCTRCYYQVFSGAKKKTAKWVYKDSDTISKYGVFERTVSTSNTMTDEEITATVNSFINDHKNPKASIDIKGLELSGITGESMDKFVIGKLFRLAIPDYEVVVENNITSVEWSDVYNNPKDVDVKLGEPEDTVVSFIHNLDTKGSGGGGSSGKKIELELIARKEFETFRVDTDERVGEYAVKVDRNGKILEKAGLDINSKGALIYTDAPNGLGSKIQTLKDSISLVVKGEGKNGKIDTAKIVLGINKQTGSFVKIKASTVDLGDYATVKSLKTTNAEIANLKSGATTASSLRTYLLSASTGFDYQGHHIVFKTVTIDGTTYHLMGY